jgi:prefoldin subunit 5
MRALARQQLKAQIELLTEQHSVLRQQLWQIRKQQLELAKRAARLRLAHQQLDALRSY